MSKYDNYLYNRLPAIYRNADTEKELKRYLQTLTESGLDIQLQSTKDLLNLIDPNKCPTEFLPYLCANFGIKYHYDVPDLYQRRVLRNVMDFYKRKGTNSAIKFIARELSGFVAEVKLKDGTLDVYLVTVKVFDEEEAKLLVAQDAIDKYIQDFIPVGLEAEVIVSYGLSEQAYILELSYCEVLPTVITEKLYENHANSILEELFEAIQMGTVEDTNEIAKNRGGITNSFRTNENLYTNRFNGIDTIIEGTETKVKFY